MFAVSLLGVLMLAWPEAAAARQVEKGAAVYAAQKCSICHSIDGKGQAFGVLSTLAIAPVPGSNGVADLAHALEYAQKHSGIKGLRLAEGDVPFAPGAVPALQGFMGDQASLLPTGPRS